MNLASFFDDVVQRHAGRTAFIFEGERMGYDTLASEVERVRRALGRLGVRKGSHVALLMANRPEWAISAFAIARAGAVIVPVSTFATPDERAYILEHSDAELLIMQRGLRKRDYVSELKHAAIACFRFDELPAGEPCERPAIEDGDDAFIIYTSGTTEKPKAVLHAHRAPVIQSMHFADYLRLTPDDRMWTSQPFFWAAGIAVSLGAMLHAGGTLILQQAFDAGEALDLIETHRATAIRSWPHQEKAMADHPSAAGRDLSSVTKLNFASPLRPLVGLARDEWGTQGGYGLTEMFTIVSDLPADAPAALRDATSGKILPHTEVRIVDGEICVKGRTFMKGYYKAHTALDEQGFFHTGDAGYIDDDGYLRWSGRMSQMIKTGGANVSPLEIERALVDFPGMKASAAIGLPHPELGQMVVLCAVRSGDADIDGDAVIAHLKGRLAAYKIPRRVLVLSESEVTFTDNEKLRVEPLKRTALERLK